MTYPPGNPGYPPAQSPASYGAPASTSFAKSEDAENNLKHYLTIAVAVLGVLTYLASYFPMVSRLLPNGDELVEKGSTLPVDLVLLAGLLAAVSLLPKAKNYLAAVDRDLCPGHAATDPGHHRRDRSRRRAVDRRHRRCRAGRAGHQRSAAGCGRDHRAGARAPSTTSTTGSTAVTTASSKLLTSSPATERSTADTRPARRPAASPRSRDRSRARRRPSTDRPLRQRVSRASARRPRPAPAPQGRATPATRAVRPTASSRSARVSSRRRRRVRHSPDCTPGAAGRRRRAQ